jgi:glycosyltransferase involved in cell wall biosynthesis
MQADKKLRIIHCFRNPIGGIFRHVRDLVEHQHNAGHEVGILCDSSTGGVYEDKLFENILPFLSLGLTRIPISRHIGIGDLIALWKCYKQIKSLQPDVLHGHGAKGGAMSRIIGSALRANRYRVARLYSPHGGSLHFAPTDLKGHLVFRLERILEWGTDSLVFVCNYEQRVYQEKIGKPRTHFEMIYNGIGEREFDIVPVRPDAVNFLFIGMMRDLKGPDVFIEAFAKTERRLGRTLTAMMIGDGPDMDRYQERITFLGLGRRITMNPAMNARTAFSFMPSVVVPSRAEAMPYIVLEALAAGRTVIASRVGGIPEILGETSRALVIPGDADDLARVMAESLTEKDWGMTVMPDPETFREAFSSATMAQKITGLYQRILDGTLKDAP